MIKGRISRRLIVGHIAAPEAFAASSDVPVGQVVGKLLYRSRGFCDLVFVEVFIDCSDERVKIGQRPSVYLRQFAFLKIVLTRVVLVYLRIQHKEGVRIPQRAHELALRFGNVFRAETRREPRSGRRIEIPSYRVCALLVQHAPRIDYVALMFGHLDTVLVVDVTEDNAVLERSAVENKRRDREQRIEPASCLVDRFRNKVRGELLIENLLVLERIVPLRERHASAVVPAVHDFGGTLHLAAAFGAFEGYRVEVGFMQFDIPFYSRQLFKLGFTADHVHFAAVFAYPYRERSAPVSFA